MVNQKVYDYLTAKGISYLWIMELNEGRWQSPDSKNQSAYFLVQCQSGTPYDRQIVTSQGKRIGNRFPCGMTTYTEVVQKLGMPKYVKAFNGKEWLEVSQDYYVQGSDKKFHKWFMQFEGRRIFFDEYGIVSDWNA